MRRPRATPTEDLLAKAAAAADERDAALADEPARRRAAGIVHTPPALASFIVREAARALRERLGVRAGLGDPRVGVVDPAVGPGVFLAAVLEATRGARSHPGAIEGRDLDASALHSAREVLGALGAHCELVQGNALDAPPVAPGQRPIAVVLGNPPWASRSGTEERSASDAMLVDFRRDERGVPLDERKLGVLSDDYVRFLRWGSEVVRRAPEGGVLGLVTNSSYLDGPVHRGLRAALLRWFAWVDVIDLGGSALIARGSTEAMGREENVFGVRPGVAILIATRPSGHGELLPSAQLSYARLRGTRAAKLAALDAPIARLRLRPDPPLFGFTARASEGWPDDAAPLPALFPFHREGVQTNRDEVAVAPDRETLLARLRAFVAKEPLPELARASTPLAHFDPARARLATARALEADPHADGGVSARPLAYRPFDDRVFAPFAPLCHRPRGDLLAAMDRSSFALLTVRKDRGEGPYHHFAATRFAVDNCFLSARSSARTRAFPTHTTDGAENLDAALAAVLFSRVGRTVGVEEALEYALGLLAAASYRARYDGALHLDYPRVLAPPSAEAFEALRSAGAATREAFEARGESDAVVGHHRATGAPDTLADALASAESAFCRAFPA